MSPLRLVALALGFAVSTPCAALTISGPWTQDGDGYVSPPVDDLAAFRDYFADVLRLYDQYAPFADELAAGVEAAGPFRLSPSSGEVENGFGADLDTGSVGFNPLATGGTQDIATGGDFIDKQLNGQKNNFEVAEVEVEENIFKQNFGPVRSTRRQAPPGGDPALEWYSFEFRGLDTTTPFPAPAFFASNLSASFAVVPEPATAGLVAVGCLLARLSRRGRRG